MHTRLATPKILKSYALSLLLVFFCSGIRSQELLMNPGFESRNICTESTAACAPECWLSLDPFCPLYRSSKGDMYLALLQFNTNRVNNRQYVQSQLLCNLVKGEKYVFSIRVLQTEIPLHALGVYFDSVLCRQEKSLLLDKTPQIVMGEQLSKGRKNKWIDVQVEYVAKGYEKYIVIGNFDTDKENGYADAKNLVADKDYRFGIDHLSLRPVKTDSICSCSTEVFEHWNNFNYRHSLFISGFSCEEPVLAAFSGSADSLPVQVDSPLIPAGKIEFITLDGNVLFGFDSDSLTAEASNHIRELAARLGVQQIRKIQIIGYTDNVGNDAYNLNLSERRAESVRRALISHQIDPAVLFTKGLGEASPVESNETESGRKKNRRIELIIETE